MVHIAIWIIAIFSVFAVVGVGITFLVVAFRDKEKLKDRPLGLNFLSNIEHGHFIVTEKEVNKGAGDRQIITYEPKDVDIDKEKIEDHTLIVQSSKLLSFPKGTLSKDKNIKFYLPPRASHLDEAFKGTIIGAGLQFAIELDNSVQAKVASLQEGNKRKDEILKEIGGGEISKEFLTLTRQLTKDYAESLFAKQSSPSPLSKPTIPLTSRTPNV